MQFEELLSDGGGRDPDLVEVCAQVVGAGRLAHPAVGEEPAGCRVGGGVHVVPAGDVLQQQGGGRRGAG
ncbi:hypothetical protein AB0L10_22875 [Streptomyces flaveolus]|uniref:hypothetical protein n=1 Tax=Streptomyces flaveolus TaxID=67297 RepID=UPI0034434174